MKACSKIAIASGKVEVNGLLRFQSDTISDVEFFKELYLTLNLSYAKFYKMDEISKLYFLAVELLLENSFWTRSFGKHTALVAGTTNGCEESDKRHLTTISGIGNSLPSPATFVYTLPNIMLGEVCIRHGITGDNTCLIMRRGDTTFLNQYTKIILAEKDVAFCITGYVNYQTQNYQCYLTLYSEE